MRTLMVIDSLDDGGTERSTADLLPELCKRGIEPTVLVLRAPGTDSVEPILRRAGVAIHVVTGGVRTRHRDLVELVDATKPALIHSALYASNLVARGARIRRSVPLLTSLVGTPYARERLAAAGIPRAKLRVAHGVDLLTSPWSTHFHAVSASVASSAHRHLRIGMHRITVVPRGRPDIRLHATPESRARVRVELGIPERATVLLSVGRQDRGKDHVTLIQAAEPLLGARTDLHLIIAGRPGTASNQINEHLSRSTGTARIHLVGHRHDVPALMAASDMFVFTSRHEGMPGVVIESLAMALPVVSTDIPAVREVLGIEPAGVLAMPGDPVSVRAAVAALLEGPERRQALAAAGRARYEEAFSLGTCADRMADLYVRVARRRGALTD